MKVYTVKEFIEHDMKAPYNFAGKTQICYRGLEDADLVDTKELIALILRDGEYMESPDEYGNLRGKHLVVGDHDFYYARRNGQDGVGTWELMML